MTENNGKVYRTVSELQWPLLCMFATIQPGSFLSVARATELDQRPFGSLYHRNWITYHPGRGFRITREGLAAYDRYMGEVHKRMHPEAPFSHYLELISDLRKPAPVEKRLAVVRRSGAA